MSDVSLNKFTKSFPTSKRRNWCREGERVKKIREGQQGVQGEREIRGECLLYGP